MVLYFEHGIVTVIPENKSIVQNYELSERLDFVLNIK